MQGTLRSLTGSVIRTHILCVLDTLSVQLAVCLTDVRLKNVEQLKREQNFYKIIITLSIWLMSEPLDLNRIF